ncbi:MAG: hypothetical protein EOM87_05120 [Clostridia bacterium]|nr:hypothetical protein [Clostridia bacterium]
MDYKILALMLKSKDFHKYVPETVRDFIDEVETDVLEAHINRVMTSPIKYVNSFDRPLYQLYFIASWANLYNSLLEDKKISLLEVATGDSCYVINALEHHSSDKGEYVTFNLNKKLSSSFIAKNIDKAVKIKVIEDNGMNVSNYFTQNSFDIIAFHHAVNDIVQTIIAEIEGIDTINCDWWVQEPEMLRAVIKHHRNGTLKQNAYGSFIKIVDVCSQVLKTGGYMIFDNRTFAIKEGLDYSTEFHDSYIAMAREWINESALPLKEITVDGYDSKWWMILKKV